MKYHVSRPLLLPLQQGNCNCTDSHTRCASNGLRYLDEGDKKTCVAGINGLVAGIGEKRELEIALNTLMDERPVKLSSE